MNWFRQAVFVQDACNLVAVIHSFAQLISYMRDNGIDEAYPPYILFRDKLQDMLGSRCEFSIYGDAYNICKERGEN